MHYVILLDTALVYRIILAVFFAIMSLLKKMLFFSMISYFWVFEVSHRKKYVRQKGIITYRVDALQKKYIFTHFIMS